MRVGLRRIDHSDQGTKGVLVFPDGVLCATLELPWRDNIPNTSCIPCGEYTAELRDSPRFGRVYEIKDVPGRSYILFHAGNVAGDVEKGYRSDVEGCILLGEKFGTLWGQLAVLNSKKAFNRFMEAADGRPFELLIEEA